MNGDFSIIPIIATVILAIIAVLNYLSRPILITSRERHTDDIRKLLDTWLEQLIRVQGKEADETPSFGEPVYETRLEVEDKSLFEDLSKHDRFNVLNCWEEYKKKLNKYKKNHHDLLKIVYQEFRDRTGMMYDRNLKHGFRWDAIKAVFEGGVFGSTIWKERIVRLETMEGGTLLKMEGSGIAKGSPKEISKTREVLSEMVLNIQSALGEEKFKIWMGLKVNLQVEKRNLELEYEKLRDKIDDFKSIPLMREPCKYVGR